MPGESDQIYVEARRALLDALEALRQHARAVILMAGRAVTPLMDGNAVTQGAAALANDLLAALE